MDWIKISEKHPDPFKDVLVWDGIRMKIGYFDFDKRRVYVAGLDYYHPTHWMELPLKPKED